MQTLLLRFDAPLMSFGTTVVDNRNPTAQFPGLSMVTGLLGNALGFTHGESAALSRLQARINYAVRCDSVGEAVHDFQTVDLGQDFLSSGGWTTRGRTEGREGGGAKEGTHIRYRDYLADACFTLALRLDEAKEIPTLTDVEGALLRPVRPLFFGRKPCLPARPILLGSGDFESLIQALVQAPLARMASEKPDGWLAWWPPEEGEPARSRTLWVADSRDWANQVHTGRRRIQEGWLSAEVTHAR